MKVFLLRIDDRRHVFYAEGPETIDSSDGEEDHRRGLRGWFERKSRQWSKTIHEKEGGFGGALKRLWNWLQRFVGPDEPLLRGLRKVRSITLHHPASMASEAARTAWLDYLKQRWRHHVIWLSVNLVLAPVIGIGLWWLPGPNVFGYWFTYRAICHSLALFGIQRAQAKEVTTSFFPLEPLDIHLDQADSERLTRLAESCGLNGLDVFLVRIGVGRNGRTEPEPSPQR